MNLRHGILGAATLILMSSVAFGQRQGSGSSTNSGVQPPSSRMNYPPMVGMAPVSGNDTSLPDAMGSRMVEQQARTRNAERQKKIEADTDKLVGLTTSLKETVQQEKEISPAELSKKAEEIEKLARSVKDRMKG